MTRQELITSREFILETIQDDISNELAKHPEAREIPDEGPTRFTDKHGLNYRRHRDALNGDYNSNLSTLVDIFRAVGKRVVIHFEDINTEPKP